MLKIKTINAITSICKETLIKDEEYEFLKKRRLIFEKKFTEPRHNMEETITL